MSHITQKAIDLDGNTVEMRYEAPKDEQGRTACGYLRPSGATYIHPMYKFAKDVGAPDESIRATHRGVDGKGTELVSDQRWIFDLAEAAELEKTEPGRFIRVDG